MEDLSEDLLGIITDYLDPKSFITLLTTSVVIWKKLNNKEFYFRAWVRLYSTFKPDQNNIELCTYKKIFTAIIDLRKQLHQEEADLTCTIESIKGNKIVKFAEKSISHTDLVINSEIIWLDAIELGGVYWLLGLLFDNPHHYQSLFSNQCIWKNIVHSREIWPLCLYLIFEEHQWLLEEMLLFPVVMEAVGRCMSRGHNLRRYFMELLEAMMIAEPKVVKTMHDSSKAEEKYALWRCLEIIPKIRHNPKLSLIQEGLFRLDAKYLQQKQGGRCINLQLQNVIKSDFIEVDRAILTAEHKHRVGLKRQSEKYWHKTVITITNNANPWPFQFMKALDKLLAKPHRFLAQVEFRVRLVILGIDLIAALPTDDELSGEIIDRLCLAEQNCVKPERVVRSPIRLHAVCQHPDEKYQIMDQIIKEGAEVSQAERVARKVLVTESIKVINPIKGFTVVLTRAAGADFVAHFKSAGQKRSVVRQGWDTLGKQKITLLSAQKSDLDSANKENSGLTKHCVNASLQ
ncbi:MAG: hypothetical protein M3R00_04215 [Pseudomonadota bacterium]|nr:hypothetical protein [Pseudomonadota bacterium]